MNYRHAFHAGNFADVLKHAVLARILVHLGAKETPFRVLDTHAGIGLYDLTADEAARTGEWQGGIARLIATPLPEPTADLLAPWLDAVALANGLTSARHLDIAHLARYPGSPLVIRAGLRHDDRALVTELHPVDAATLAELFAGDARLKVVELDGWQAVRGFLPFKERRGLVVIDPPFEQDGEFDRIVRALVDGHRRFATGVYMVWHTWKNPAEIARYHQRLAETGLRRILSVEFAVAPVRVDGPLTACGLTLVNPPWKLAEEIETLLPVLVARLAVAPGAVGRVRWIVPE